LQNNHRPQLKCVTLRLLVFSVLIPHTKEYCAVGKRSLRTPGLEVNAEKTKYLYVHIWQECKTDFQYREN